MHTAPPAALDAGFHQALIAASIFMLAAALLALRTPSTRGEPLTAELDVVRQEPAADLANRSPEVPSSAARATGATGDDG